MVPASTLLGKNKYSARKTTVNGHTFDSKKEANRYSEFKLLEAAGEIDNLTLQEPFKFYHNVATMRYLQSKTGRKEREIIYLAALCYLTLA